MRIAIFGTRGIPNYYGGFEQFAQYLSEYLVKKGHEVWVYNGHDHPYKEPKWNGVNIIHAFNPEVWVGTPGQFIYDLNCVLDTRKRQFDIILQLGYTSSSVWNWLFPKSSFLLTNMDGLEWKRSKYSKPVQRFLRYAEKLATKFSDCLVADSIGIKTYLKKKYNQDSVYIPYGAHVFESPDEVVLEKYQLYKNDYSILVARFEPENNIETILDGYLKSNVDKLLVVIGNDQTKYGVYLKEKFTNDKIRFLGTIYDLQILNNLRYYSYVYFHGHSVGGTNPSLLEAMASWAFIFAHDNIFNRSILDNDAIYFDSSDSLSQLLNQFDKNEKSYEMVKSNIEKIKQVYSWDNVNYQYECLMKKSLTDLC
ncbi:DUF1972 domain-containing protein [Cytophagaceae bacterium ABcell3]|nr:DUF1972 domain-containing protein [Cytophagaceae bacterium ABcell3]